MGTWRAWLHAHSSTSAGKHDNRAVGSRVAVRTEMNCRGSRSRRAGQAPV